MLPSEWETRDQSFLCFQGKITVLLYQAQGARHSEPGVTGYKFKQSAHGHEYFVDT